MEMYLAVIRVLEHSDALAQPQIIRKAGIPNVPVKDFFVFLVKLGLIHKRSLGNNEVYSLTDKGQRLCDYFGLDDDTSIFNGSGIFRID